MLRKIRARKNAEELVKKLGIHKAPIDVFKVVKQLEDIPIKITEEAFPNDFKDVSAILIKEKGQAVIAVNNKHSKSRQRFSIAHELGHLILHSNDENLKVDKQFFTRAESVHNLDEIEANEFAAALLMPEDLIKEDFDKLLKEDVDDIISRLAEKYDVSQDAITYRLKNLNLLG